MTINCTGITSFAVLEELDTRVEEAHQADDKRRLARLQTAVEEVVIVIAALGKEETTTTKEFVQGKKDIWIVTTYESDGASAFAYISEAAARYAIEEQLENHHFEDDEDREAAVDDALTWHGWQSDYDTYEVATNKQTIDI